MKKLVAIGEALIDFIPAQRDCPLKSVEQFTRVCGGAPANVASVVARLGGQSQMITQLGMDAFGDYIVDTLHEIGVDTSSICRTDIANTALAFVSLKADGNRDFSFYRKPSADLLLQPAQLRPEWFAQAGVLHFCSVSLVDSPMQDSHRKAIRLAKEAGALISFDPNIRLPLWRDAETCRERVQEFLPCADVFKISDEELEFVTGKDKIEDAAEYLFASGCSMILYSMGKQGAMLLTPQGSCTVENPDVPVKDTTGAGDAIIGSFLYCLTANDATKESIAEMSMEELQTWLEFAVYYANYSVMGSGAIASYPDYDTFTAWMQTTKQKG